jgi:hypothetical protein
MENPKTKPKSAPNKVTFFYNYSPSNLDFVNNKQIAYEGYVTQKHHTLEFSSKSSKTYISFLSSGEFDKWCSHVDSIEIDFQKEFSSSIIALKSRKNDRFNYWNDVLSDFIEAIKEYTEQKNELKETYHSRISEESARHFLFLAPLLVDHEFHIYIDSSNGCFNVDFCTRDNGLLTTLISENGHVHYSYVAQNKKIFKITGTAKFKDSKDFIKFNKVLQML